MKIVVTGGSGNVGTALRRHLPFEDAQVDVRAPSSLRDAVRGADVVLHLAGAIKPTDRETNVDGTGHLLTACAEEEVGHLVVASSVAAYAPTQRWSRIDESWPLTGIPGSSYKVRLEEMTSRCPLPYPVIEKLAGATARLRLQPLTPQWVRMADQAPLVHTTRAHEDLEWWPEHDARDVQREVVTAMGGRA